MRKTQMLLLLSTLATKRVYSTTPLQTSAQDALKLALKYHQEGSLMSALDYYNIVISNLGNKVPMSVYSNKGAVLLALDKISEHGMKH